MSDAASDRPTTGRAVRVALLGTPLYEKPDEASGKLAYLNEGTIVHVLGEEKGFFQVKLGGAGTGYVRISATEETGDGDAGATA